jgi:hypothetical protein
MMKRNIRQAAWTLTGALTIASLAALPASALGKSQVAATKAGTDQAKLQRIINRGNNEIGRRITSLQKLNGKISGAVKLTDSDKAGLTSEVNAEIAGLTSLKTKLDADTVVADAQTDAKSIITGYRVYAFIMPKVSFLRAADDQQVAEAKLAALLPNLQSRVDSAKAAGKNVTSLTSGLSDMSTQITSAQAISGGVESAVINLQPSDFNSDHTVLRSYRDKLKTAQTDIRAAVGDANSIVDALKNL